KCQVAMRLLGRGRQESLIGAYEKPPAMPEDTYLVIFQAWVIQAIPDCILLMSVEYSVHS
ncbi:hypothetical protein, partial [Pluralibacter gergoviae]|uniref:hypothetical protein n=1 Tax=Pluralibacter gergoviae TaxID=61647 RepID=UPI00290FB179